MRLLLDRLVDEVLSSKLASLNINISFKALDERLKIPGLILLVSSPGLGWLNKNMTGENEEFESTKI